MQIEDTNQQKEIEEFNTNNDIDGLNAELWLDMPISMGEPMRLSIEIQMIQIMLIWLMN